MPNWNPGYQFSSPFTTQDAWYDITGGISAPSIFLIGAYNASETDAPTVGFRDGTDQVAKTVKLHEAESGGVTMATFLVYVPSNGYVQGFTTATATTYWTVLGYWLSPGIFTNRFEDISPTATGWTDYNATANSGIPKGCVASLLLLNYNNGAATTLGCRTDGSTLSRYIALHEAESATTEYTDATAVLMNVKVDEVTGYFERYSSDTTYGKIFLLGWFADTMDYTEKMQTLTLGTSAAWTDSDLTSYLDYDGQTVDIFCGNNNTSTEKYVGARGNGDANEPMFNIHEAEGAGIDGFSQICKTDTSGIVELYCTTNTNGTFYLLGCYKTRQIVTDTLAVGNGVSSPLGKLGYLTTRYIYGTNYFWGNKVTAIGDLKSVQFALGKNGSPSGDVYIEVYRNSDHAVIDSRVWMDASTLTTTQTDMTYNYATPVALTYGVAYDIMVRFPSGVGTANCVKISTVTGILKTGHHTRFFNTTWQDYNYWERGYFTFQLTQAETIDIEGPPELIDIYDYLYSQEVVQVLSLYLKTTLDNIYSSEAVTIPYQELTKYLTDSIVIAQPGGEAVALVGTSWEKLIYETLTLHERWYAHDPYEYVGIYGPQNGLDYKQFTPNRRYFPVEFYSSPYARTVHFTLHTNYVSSAPRGVVGIFDETVDLSGTTDTFWFTNALAGTPYDLMVDGFYCPIDSRFYFLYNYAGVGLVTRRALVDSGYYRIAFEASYYSVEAGSTTKKGIGYAMAGDSVLWASWCEYNAGNGKWYPTCTRSTGTNYQTWTQANVGLSTDDAEICKVVPFHGPEFGSSNGSLVMLWSVDGAEGACQLWGKRYSGGSWGDAFSITTDMRFAFDWSWASDKHGVVYLSYISLDFLDYPRPVVVKIPESGDVVVYEMDPIAYKEALGSGENTYYYDHTQLKQAMSCQITVPARAMDQHPVMLNIYSLCKPTQFRMRQQDISLKLNSGWTDPTLAWDAVNGSYAYSTPAKNSTTTLRAGLISGGLGWYPSGINRIFVLIWARKSVDDVPGGLKVGQYGGTMVDLEDLTTDWKLFEVELPETSFTDGMQSWQVQAWRGDSDTSVRFDVDYMIINCESTWDGESGYTWLRRRADLVSYCLDGMSSEPKVISNSMHNNYGEELFIQAPSNPEMPSNEVFETWFGVASFWDTYYLYFTDSVRFRTGIPSSFALTDTLELSSEVVNNWPVKILLDSLGFSEAISLQIGGLFNITESLFITDQVNKDAEMIISDITGALEDTVFAGIMKAVADAMGISYEDLLKIEVYFAQDDFYLSEIMFSQRLYILRDRLRLFREIVLTDKQDIVTERIGGRDTYLNPREKIIYVDDIIMNDEVSKQ